MAPAGDRLYVGVVDHLDVIDLSTLAVVGTVAVGARPYRAIPSAEGTRLYVSNLYGSSVSVVDTAARTEIARVPTGVLPGGLALTPDGTQLYVANNCPGFLGGDDTVTVIDTGTNTATTTITGLGSGACGVAMAPRCTTNADCNDDDPCTTDLCSTATGTCTYAPLPDTDGDAVCDAVDNCPTVANPGQEDNDLDGIGNACDTACTVGTLSRTTRHCETTAARALHACTAQVTMATRACYVGTNAACAPTDPTVLAATARVSAKVLAACTDADLAALCVGQEGQGLTAGAFATRLQTACLDEPATLAARTFGGPQAAVLAPAPPIDRRCLGTAFKQEGALVVKAFQTQSTCVTAAHGGKGCDPAAVGAQVTAAAAKATAAVAKACPSLVTLVGMDAASLGSRALAEARCLVATVHAQPGLLALDCGPRPALAVPGRGRWVQVVLDPAASGAACGDGSPFAFWFRLAPVGSAAEHVLVDLQSGTPCLGDGDCSANGWALHVDSHGAPPASGVEFTPPPGTVPTVNGVAVNPFADWTRVFIPQCSLDLHVGGGVTDVFPHVTVGRFGALNLRAALRYVRDVLWTALDGAGGEGFRPDRLRVVLSGTSGGGYGAAYNYHYLLDELRWTHTTAVTDAALALDNGGVLQALRALMVAGAPSGWGSLPYLAPYCRDVTCAEGPVLLAATSPRLGETPDQQMLILSSQVDSVQQSTTFFPSLPSWIAALRSAYCANQGRNGLHYFLPGTNVDVHGLLDDAGTMTQIESVGVSPAAWLAGALTAPASVADAVEEGALAAAYGVGPFACPVH